MKTKDFIRKYAQIMRTGEVKKDAHCSSVFYSDGRLYSYGRHYPLLWPVEKPDGTVVLVCNARGYSVTTSKHIGWCWQDADVYVHNTYIGGIEGLRAQLNEEIYEKKGLYASKKRKDTQIANRILEDIEQIKGYLAKLTV